MRTQATAVFFLSLAVFLANGRPHPEVDCVAAPFTAWAIARHGSLDLSRYPQLENLRPLHVQATTSGGWVSLRPPGAALSALPFVAPFAWASEKPLSDQGMLLLGKFAAAASVAGAAVFLFLAASRVCPGAAWPVALLFALGTCLFSVASQALWMHGPATFWLAFALWLLTRPNAAAGLFVAGLALGMAVLCRPTAALFAIASGLALLVQRRWGGTAWLTFGGAIPVAFLCLLNLAQFGHPLLGGYAADNWAESPPWWLGLGGLLVAPSRGLLVYTPAVLLVIPGAWLLLRRDRPWSESRAVLACWLGGAAATVAFHARWHDWRGGWCYGPRFLCEAMPVLCLLAGVGYAAMRGPWRAVAHGLVALSIAVHAVGAFGYSGYEDWQKRHDRGDQGRCLFELNDTQIEAHARALLAKVVGGRKRDEARP